MKAKGDYIQSRVFIVHRLCPRQQGRFLLFQLSIITYQNDPDRRRRALGGEEEEEEKRLVKGERRR